MKSCRQADNSKRSMPWKMWGVHRNIKRVTENPRCRLKFGTTSTQKQCWSIEELGAKMLRARREGERKQSQRNDAALWSCTGWLCSSAALRQATLPVGHKRHGKVMPRHTANKCHLFEVICINTASGKYDCMDVFVCGCALEFRFKLGLAAQWTKWVDALR